MDRKNEPTCSLMDQFYPWLSANDSIHIWKQIIRNYQTMAAMVFVSLHCHLQEDQLCKVFQNGGVSSWFAGCYAPGRIQRSAQAICGAAVLTSKLHCSKKQKNKTHFKSINVQTSNERNTHFQVPCSLFMKIIRQIMEEKQTLKNILLKKIIPLNQAKQQ